MMNLLLVTLNTVSMQASQCCVWASKKKKKKKILKTESKYKVLGKVTNIRKHVSLFQSETFNFTLL